MIFIPARSPAPISAGPDAQEFYQQALSILGISSFLTRGETVTRGVATS
jgi:hypothetical protein